MNRTELLFTSLLQNCKSLQSIKQLHVHTIKTGLDNDTFFVGKCILHCAVTISDALDYARRLLLHFPNPDVFMYNTLIRGFSNSDQPQKALITYTEMRKKLSVIPDSFSFAFVLKGIANYRCLRAGIQIHCQALCYGFETHLFVGTTLVSMYAECGSVCFARKVFDKIPEPNIVAWNAILTALFRCNELKSAEEVFNRMPFRDLTSWNVMIAGYAKDGDLELAKKLFLEMPVKDDVSWSTMIVGFSHHGCFDDAFSFFKELHSLGSRPNEVSLTGVLSSCAQSGAFEFGKIIHGFVEKSGFNRIISVNNALLDTYSRCGNINMACLVFEKMPQEKNIVSWTSMITGLAMHGHGNDAIDLFHKMEEHGIIPDKITLVSILYACSHAGLVKPGHYFFEKMVRDYNIEPEIEHYGCMVDLYGRSGHLQKAYDFINQMSIPKNPIIWRILLGTCSIHGHVKFAEIAKNKLFELDPINSGDHVLLSNMYANAGNWENVDFVRKSMSVKKIKKNPGWSMIQVNKLMYRFLAGEVTNKITEEAYEKLKEIMIKIRVEGGYVPEVKNVLHDIEDEEKEDSISRHSEKLAVAFGIARLSNTRSIRIVKNLRVCSDCHTVMKLISKVFRLEIVVRDRNRFHLFEYGLCSCKDYW